MPIDFTPQDDEESQQSGQAQPVGAPSASGAATPIGPQAGTLLNYSAPAGGKAPGSPTSSGSWTNLQSYLNANQGSGFGQQFTGDIQNQVNAADQAIGTAGSNFQSEVNQNVTQANPNLVNQAVTDPTDFVNNPNNISQWNQQFDANYAGPSSLSADANDYNSANTAVTNAQQAASADQTEGGRFALLNQYFGGNGQNYTQGQQGLDNFLLQSDPNVQSNLANINNQATQLTNNWNQAQTNAQNEASQATGIDQATAQAAQNAIGVDQNGNLLGSGAIPTLENNINNQVSTLNTAAPTNYTNFINAINSGTITQADANALGASPNSSTYAYYGAPISQYISQAPTATATSVATPQQYAQMQALSQLAGINNTYLPTADASQAGTATATPTVNTTGLNAAIAQGQTQAQTNINNAEGSTMVTLPSYMETYVPQSEQGGVTFSQNSPNATMNLNLASQAYSDYLNQNGAASNPTIQNQYATQVYPQIQAILQKYASPTLNISG